MSRLFLVSFFLLLGGYAGIKWFYDRATTPSTIGFIILVLASFATGVGGNCGNTAAMNTTAKSFPDRMVCMDPGHVFNLSDFVDSEQPLLAP